MQLKIRNQAVPGTHGRMLSKSIFEVREEVLHHDQKKYPGRMVEGKKLYEGTHEQCEEFVEQQKHASH